MKNLLPPVLGLLGYLNPALPEEKNGFPRLTLDKNYSSLTVIPFHYQAINLGQLLLVKVRKKKYAF